MKQKNKNKLQEIACISQTMRKGYNLGGLQLLQGGRT